MLIYCYEPDEFILDVLFPERIRRNEIVRTEPLNGIRERFSLSPSEGDRIAFERDASDFSASRIMLMNPDGSGVITIQAEAFVPSWGPAG